MLTWPTTARILEDVDAFDASVAGTPHVMIGPLRGLTGAIIARAARARQTPVLGEGSTRTEREQDRRI